MSISLENALADFAVHLQDLVDGQAALEAGVVAGGAALALEIVAPSSSWGLWPEARISSGLGV